MSPVRYNGCKTLLPINDRNLYGVQLFPEPRIVGQSPILICSHILL
jgi:hypothetical protein